MLSTRTRILVDGRWLSGAPHSSHARYLGALVTEWAALTDWPDVTLVGTGPCPPGVHTTGGIRWQQVPALPSRFGGRPGGRLWLNTVFSAVTFRHRPDVLFFPWSVLPRVLLAPAVVTVHDVCFRSHPECFADGGRSGNRQIAAAARRAAHIVTPSHISKRQMVAAYGTPPDRVTVVWHGISPAFHPRDTPADDSARQALGLPSDYFLCVSTQEERKNLLVLARGYAGLADSWQGPGELPSLVFVGRPSPYTALVRDVLARAPRAAARVIFLYSASEEQLAALYRGALGCVLPSLCEGFGFPLVEALACGTLPIASDLPVFHELAGDAALYVPPRDAAAWTDALGSALRNPHLRESAQVASSDVARKFTWKRSASETLALLQRAAHEQDAGSPGAATTA